MAVTQDLHKQVLPETINLHNMVCNSVTYNQYPIEVGTTLKQNAGLRENATFEFELEDYDNEITVTIRINTPIKER